MTTKLTAKPADTVKLLAEEHWSYIEELLETHAIDSLTTDTCRFHYISAFIHGYKHGQEDLNKHSLPMFPTKLGT